MTQAPDIVARSRRFAHLIVSCADEAERHVFDVISEQRQRLSGDPDDESLRQDIYRSLCDRLSRSAHHPASKPDPGTLPVIWKFRNLPVMNRMAFALMVIEEFPSETAATILRIPDETLEEKIMQSRKLLFGH